MWTLRNQVTMEHRSEVVVEQRLTCIAIEIDYQRPRYQALPPTPNGIPLNPSAEHLQSFWGVECTSMRTLTSKALHRLRIQLIKR